MDDIETAARLGEFEAEINNLLSMIEKRPLSISQKKAAQLLLKDLKSTFRREFEVRDSVIGQRSMTKPERDYFYPAMQEADAGINVRWNSVPDDDWYSELYSVQISIRFYRSSVI